MKTRTASPTKHRPRQRAGVLPPCSYPTGKKPGRMTNVDEVWSEMCVELELAPTLTVPQILKILKSRYPGKFRDAQLNTVRDKLWRYRVTHHPDEEWRKDRGGKKSTIDEVWSEICQELEQNPTATVRGIMAMLCERYLQIDPKKHANGKAQCLAQ